MGCVFEFKSLCWVQFSLYIGGVDKLKSRVECGDVYFPKMEIRGSIGGPIRDRASVEEVRFENSSNLC